MQINQKINHLGLEQLASSFWKMAFMKMITLKCAPKPAALHQFISNQSRTHSVGKSVLTPLKGNQEKNQDPSLTDRNLGTGSAFSLKSR